MNEFEKYSRLSDRLVNFALALRNDNRLIVHQKINEFYYLQKTEELRLLLEQLDVAVRKLDDVRWRLEKNYTAAFCQWQKDARWLIQYPKKET